MIKLCQLKGKNLKEKNVLLIIINKHKLEITEAARGEQEYVRNL
jgi:hypothetical protein